MNVQSLRGMSNTSLSMPWNRRSRRSRSNAMSNCILARSPSNITVCSHDDCPCSLKVASVTVSEPI